MTVDEIHLTLPDGSSRAYSAGTTVRQLAESIGPGLARAALAGRVDGEVIDLDRQIGRDASVEIVTDRSPGALELLRHSAAHVLATAVRRVRPEAKIGFGPAIENGFYYDFDVDRPFTPEELESIAAEMEKVVEADDPFERRVVTREEARELFSDDPLKLERLEELARDEVISVYRNGGFLDLCRGPHLPSTGRLEHFRLLSTAAAYWRGDQTRQTLQRVYGTAWFSRKELDAHLHRLEEAKKRDHRVLGPKLGLFTVDAEVGQGLVLWRPKGAVVRHQLQEFIRGHLEKQGYQQVFTPHIGKLELYRRSGHYPYYADSQFPPLLDKDEVARLAGEGTSCAELANRMAAGRVEGYMLKPMNCPHHIRVFASEPHSYRDLPVRLAEFGTVYRWEQSGELGGMTRVRGFTQDDAHIFCTEEQLAAEINACLELVRVILGTLGMAGYRVRVGLRGADTDKYAGEPERWERAEAACRDAADRLGVPYTPEPGEAAFYGPKIDFVVKDVIGREWQLGTVQVDYQLPERFDLSYTGPDNQPHRPVIIHRAPFGSMERFIGVLIEHFGGAFPVWLAPVQVVVLPISEDQSDSAVTLAAELREAGLRVQIDDRNETLNYRIREQERAKVPYMAVIGAREVESGTVAVRIRGAGSKQVVLGREVFLQRVRGKVESRELENELGDTP
ncbi:MAG: threonine--tRNA ligase [Longimicrobiaceae bacterium]